MDYWIEHAEIALSEAGLPPATPQQLDAIAGVIESAHDHYSQSMGYDVADVNYHGAKEREHRDALARLEREKEKEAEAASRKIKRILEEKQRIQFALEDARRELSKGGA